MKFWQNVSWMETDQLIETAKFAEEVGFEGVMDGDHVAFPVPLHTPYPYSPDGKPPMGPTWNYPDNFASAAAIAAVTTRLRYITGVFVLPARDPLIVAKAAGTVAILGNHRFILGIAAGWMKEEFDMTGVDFQTRGKRLDEMIEAMRLLWQGGVVEYRGKFIDFPPLQISPAPGRPVPVYVGGVSPVAIKRAARLGDGWMGSGDTVEDTLRMLSELARLRREAGRDHLPFEAIAAVAEPPDVDMYKRLEAGGAAGAVAYPFMFTIGPTSTLDQKKRAMEQFAKSFIRPFQR